MASILKVTAKWDGFVGAPGYSNFYWKEEDPGASFDAGAVACGDAVQKFFNDIKLYFPPHVKWRVQTDVPVINDATGEMVDIASAGARGDIVGGAGNFAYSAPTGAVVTWRSNGVRNGRRVRGRTFLVPTANNIYQSDGTIDNTHLNEFVTSATALATVTGTQLPLVVWARPSVPGGSDGAAHVVTSASVPDMAAVLRSRRG